MTNREKAERCGEFVRDGLDCLLIVPSPHGSLSWWLRDRDAIVEGTRQAGHWGRLALADKVAS